MTIAGGTLRENNGIGTRLKQGMQTHGFLERNGYNTPDNVEERGERRGEKVVVKRRGMERIKHDSVGLL